MPSAQKAGYAPIPTTDSAPSSPTLAPALSLDSSSTTTRRSSFPNPAGPNEDSSYRPLRRSVQDEFNRAPPAWWKRLLLIIGLVAMGWAVMYFGGMGKQKPQVIFASRYSEEYKYRPAASPVITEYLKDGRIRLRGAAPGGVGILEADLPMSEGKKAVRDEKRREEARDKAKAKLGLKTRKDKLKEKKKSREEETRRKMNNGRAKEDI